MGLFLHPPSPKNRRGWGKIVNPLFKFSFANLVYPRATVCLCEGRGGVGTVSPVRGLGLLVLGYECGGYAARGLRLLLTRRFIRFPGLCFWETAMKAYGRVAGPSLPLGDAARSHDRERGRRCMEPFPIGLGGCCPRTSGMWRRLTEAFPQGWPLEQYSTKRGTPYR